MIQRFRELDLQVDVPADAHTLEGFRAWVRSGTFPEHGRIALVQGELLIDMSPERLGIHNKIKTEIASVLHALAKRLHLGEIFSDGVWLTNAPTGLSAEPDALFASWDCIRKGRVQLIPRGDEVDGFELTGCPDWVLEIVSPSSERKDLRVLRRGYYDAGIREYWIVDARGESVQLSILSHEEEDWREAQAREQWLYSPVFGRKFLLARRRSEGLGGWEYTLRHRLVRPGQGSHRKKRP
jgi:Uma2 family endonuclease